ncbi:MAG: class II fructose-bisphosphate aldolase [Anaerolineaceae bacterium]|jgi:ketose-bisphosphate aldolase|nr:class II fructose-bisphosphate aldolase [Anaerolineaceae bacterium]MDD4042463.1 class II fructose-bisphosphate aldolase [Anaerolineaceae bacterium]
MPLVSERELLDDARARGYAIPGLFPFDMDTIKIIIDAAEEAHSPVIILQGPEFIEDFGPEIFTAAVKAAAHTSNVPVGIAVDHTFRIDDKTFPRLMKCIHLGWKSIMIDGSLLPYEENVRITKEIARICHAAGVACCAALGEVKRFFPGVKDQTEYFHDDFIVTDDLKTDPEQAREFVNLTKVDSLAISIGQYVRSLWEKETLPIKRVARLDFDRLHAIRSLTDVHLILHGSTYVDIDDLTRAAGEGISEIKAATEYGIIWSTEIRDTLVQNPALMFPIDIQKPALQKTKETMVFYMHAFKSAGKA